MDIIEQANNHLEQAYSYFEESEDFEKALEECDVAIELDPYLVEAYNLRGILLEELGRPTEAIRAYKRAIKLDPNFIDAKDNLTELKSDLVTSEGLVTIAKFKLPTEGHILKAKLEAEGIWSFVAAIDNVAITSGGNLQVKEEDVEKALDALNQEIDFSDWSDEDFYIGEEFDIERVTADSLPRAHSLEISGFWRRFFAFIIDGIILSIPLLIFGFIFRDLAFALGPWGRLVGFGVIWLYWGILSSRLGSGQTIGKRFMSTAVIDRDGEFLSIGRSLFRSFILVIIGFLNGWASPLLENPVVVIVTTTIVVGGGLALLYGLIVNRTTRQGIHDLLAKSYVINVPPPSEFIIPNIPSIHKKFSFGLVSLGLVIGIAGYIFWQSDTKPTFGILEPGEWEEIQQLYSILSEDDEFFIVSVQRNNRSELGALGGWKELDIQVWAKTSCSRNPEYCYEVVERIARTALEEYEGIDDLTGMQIIVFNRFDLGIANGKFSLGDALTIDNWRLALEQ